MSFDAKDNIAKLATLTHRVEPRQQLLGMARVHEPQVLLTRGQRKEERKRMRERKNERKRKKERQTETDRQTDRQTDRDRKKKKERSFQN